MPPGRTTSLLRLAPRLLLSLATLLSAAGALEAGARLWLGDAFVPGFPVGRPDQACAHSDPDLGWANRPGVHTRVVAPTFGYTLTINEHGLRDRDHPFAKPEGVFRVLLLGDSVAWGWGVDDGLAFADLIEPPLGVEVINLGVPGYSTDQQLWALERDGWRYEPDLVLLCFILNDVSGNNGTHFSKLHKPRYVRRPDGEWVLEGRPVPDYDTDPDAEAHSLSLTLRVHSALLQWLRPLDTEPNLAVGRAGGGRNPWAVTAFERERLEAARSLVAQIASPGTATDMLLGRLREACAAKDVPLVAFGVAHHHDRYLYSAVSAKPPAVTGPDHRSSMTQQLALAGRRHGFATFSVDEAMLARTDAGVDLHCGDGHLDAEGNRVVAARIVEELEPVISAVRDGTYVWPAPESP